MWGRSATKTAFVDFLTSLSATETWPSYLAKLLRHHISLREVHEVFDDPKTSPGLIYKCLKSYQCVSLRFRNGEIDHPVHQVEAQECDGEDDPWIFVNVAGLHSEESFWGRLKRNRGGGMGSSSRSTASCKTKISWAEEKSCERCWAERSIWQGIRAVGQMSHSSGKAQQGEGAWNSSN